MNPYEHMRKTTLQLLSGEIDRSSLLLGQSVQYYVILSFPQDTQQFRPTVPLGPNSALNSFFMCVLYKPNHRILLLKFYLAWFGIKIDYQFILIVNLHDYVMQVQIIKVQSISLPNITPVEQNEVCTLLLVYQNLDCTEAEKHKCLLYKPVITSLIMLK